MTSETDISVVVPVFNEKGSIKELNKRLSSVLSELNRSYEVIYVNDGSNDGSGEMLRKIAEKDDHVTVIEFNRNYGQHQAVFAGFEKAWGEVVITIDADLQNPPEEIPKLIEKSDEAYEIVFSVRQKRKDSLLRMHACCVQARHRSRHVLFTGNLHIYPHARHHVRRSRENSASTRESFPAHKRKIQVRSHEADNARI